MGIDPSGNVSLPSTDSVPPGDGVDTTIVCILGMSRTGTSLVTRLLSIAGVYLGAEEELLQRELRQLESEGGGVLRKAEQANPEGFWEHYRAMRLNERILRAFGGSWREPPDLPPGWEDSERLAVERDEARALINESFGGQRLWAWKDPRNSLTLPFWKRLLPKMRYVICLRNPLDVARSLERRDGMALEQGIDLWSFYLASALGNTSGQPRLLLSYESFFADAPAVATRLARFVGRDGALDGSKAKQLVSKAIDRRLWRNRTALADVVSDRRVPSEAIALHLLSTLLGASSNQLGASSGGFGSGADSAVDLYAQSLLDRDRDGPRGRV